MAYPSPRVVGGPTGFRLRRAPAWQRIALAALLAAALADCARAPARPAAAGTATHAAARRLDAYAAERAGEIALARQAAQDMEAATSALAPALRVRMRGVKTVTQHVVDHPTKLARDVEVLESLAADLPLGLRGSPEHDAAMAPVKQLATGLAATRGSAVIDRAFSVVDARNDRILAQQDTVKTVDGREVTVRRLVDPEQLRGFEHVTVRTSVLPSLP